MPIPTLNTLIKKVFEVQNDEYVNSSVHFNTIEGKEERVYVAGCTVVTIIDAHNFSVEDDEGGWQVKDDKVIELWHSGEYLTNMPCDNTGTCAGTSCSRYYECHKS